MGLIRWLDKVAGRASKKIESSAVAVSTEGATPGQTVNAPAVKLGIDEVEKAEQEAQPDEST